MSKLKSPRGCPDWLPEDNELAESIFHHAKKWAEIYDFSGYKTPIFEHAEVFTKTLGDSSDIITKEMYSFSDKNDELFILRPESTAPLIRLFLSHKLQRSAPLKMFTYGPMFRYERPQKGRQRQFHQIGAEHVGGAKNIYTHFEIITMGWNFINSLNIESPLRLTVNNLGTAEERATYKENLIKYLTPLKEKLSVDSQKRLETNPLRILDSKEEQDQNILKNAPLLTEFINPESLQETKDLIKLCEDEGIKAELNPKLVRGLDYYNDLVFEIVSDGELGSQNTVLAGGRYDKLIESMGGQSMEAIGWGAGLERLMLLSKLKPSFQQPIGVVFNSKDLNGLSRLSNTLRKEKLPTFIPTSGNFSKKLLKCQKKNCNYTIIIGEDELKNNTWSLKEFETGEQTKGPPEEILNKLRHLSIL